MSVDFQTLSTAIATEILVGLSAAASGALLTLGATRVLAAARTRFRHRHVEPVLGPVAELRGRVTVVLSAFEPATRDEFSAGEPTHVYKSSVGGSSGTVTTRREVPLYSDVVTVDEYYAYCCIEGLLARHGYSPAVFVPDNRALALWDSPLFVCLGGPRSNQKLRQILNAGSAPAVRIQDDPEVLGDHVYEILVDGQVRSFRPSIETAYGFVLKVRNPKRDRGSVIAIAGDSAYSTMMAARFLAERTDVVAERFGRRSFFLLLVSDRDCYDTVQMALAVDL